jgi:hypothetical protein
MPSDPTDRPSSHIAAVVPAPGDELASAMPVLPGRSAAGNGDDLTTTAARNSPATAHDDDVTGNAPTLSGAFIYGYDSAGKPDPHGRRQLTAPPAASRRAEGAPGGKRSGPVCRAGADDICSSLGGQGG